MRLRTAQDVVLGTCSRQFSAEPWPCNPIAICISPNNCELMSKYAGGISAFFVVFATLLARLPLEPEITKSHGDVQVGYRRLDGVGSFGASCRAKQCKLFMQHVGTGQGMSSFSTGCFPASPTRRNAACCRTFSGCRRGEARDEHRNCQDDMLVSTLPEGCSRLSSD